MGGFFAGSGATQIPSGTVAVPGLAYGADLTTGFYHPAGGYLGISVNGQTGGLIDPNANTSFGRFTFQSLTTGTFNTAFGSGSLSALTTGINNVCVGFSAGNVLIGGAGNVAIGSGSLSANTGGNTNTAIGSSALIGNIVGNGNVALGNSAGAQELGSNTLYISNTNTTTPLIKGVFDPLGGFVGSLTFNAASQAITDGVNTTTVKPGGVMGNVTAGGPGAGFIGESIKAVVLQANAQALTTGVTLTIAFIVLTPGTWDIDVCAGFTTDAATNIQQLSTYVTNVANGGPVVDDGFAKINFGAGVVPGVQLAAEFMNAPTKQVTVTVNTNYYLGVTSFFSAGTIKAFGQIYARRTG